MVNIGRLSNKVARVTDASKGIGGGIATAFGVAGARVAVNYSSDREGAVLAAKAPLGRLGRVIDIAPLAVFLASDESAWITREVIRASGGLLVAF